MHPALSPVNLAQAVVVCRAQDLEFKDLEFLSEAEMCAFTLFFPEFVFNLF